MLERLLVAVPLAALATGGLFLSMRMLTDIRAERPPAMDERPDIDIGRTMGDTDSHPKPRPRPFHCPSLRAGLDGCPHPVVRVRPEYPDCGSGTGEVLLDFAVEPDGTVSDIKVINATSPCFAEAAIRAAMNWLYQPAIVGGKPMRSRSRAKIIFEPE